MKKNKIISLICLMALTFACSDDLLTENPPNIIAAANLYVDYPGFQSGLNALYANVRYENSGTGPINSTGNLRRGQMQRAVMIAGTDNLYANWPFKIGRLLDQWGVLNSPTDDNWKVIWDWAYAMINAANTIIERVNYRDLDLTDQQKKEIEAEARCIRAWTYRHLTYLWGDVPLNIEESTGLTIKDWTRTPISEIFKVMEEDWLFAEEYLPETTEHQEKVVKGVATHYLAEHYLRIGENDLAEQKAADLINNGPFRLITERYGVEKNQLGVPFMDMFKDGNSNRNEGNTEAIWVFQFEYGVTGGGLSGMRRELVNRYWSLKIGGKTPIAIDYDNGGRGEGRFSPTKYALDLYEDQDDRFSDYAFRKYYLFNSEENLPDGYALGDTLWLDWSSGESASNPHIPSTRKWDWTLEENPLEGWSYNDQIYLRLAETYLLLAEAQFKLGDLSEAAETLNVLRRRSNASEINAADVTLDFILDERSRELITEEERRYTLLRLGLWVERTKMYNKMPNIQNITDRDKLLPIPQHAIDANIELTMEQNPGY